MEIVLRKFRIPLFVSVVITIAGCFPNESFNTAEIKKYTGSPNEKAIVIGRIIAPLSDSQDASRWLLLQKLRDDKYPERTLSVKVGAEGWFNASLEPGTYCLISYIYRKVSFSTEEKTSRIMAVFEKADSEEAAYIGTFVYGAYGKWAIKNESEMAVLRMSKAFPSYKGKLITQLSVLKEQR